MSCLAADIAPTEQTSGCSVSFNRRRSVVSSWMVECSMSKSSLKQRHTSSSPPQHWRWADLIKPDHTESDRVLRRAIDASRSATTFRLDRSDQTTRLRGPLHGPQLSFRPDHARSRAIERTAALGRDRWKRSAGHRAPIHPRVPPGWRDTQLAGRRTDRSTPPDRSRPRRSWRKGPIHLEPMGPAPAGQRGSGGSNGKGHACPGRRYARSLGPESVEVPSSRSWVGCRLHAFR